MSSASEIYQIFIHNYLHLLGITVFYYDYALTFGEEYRRFWKPPKSRPSWLFFLNRYLTFFGDIAVNVGNFYNFPTEASCNHYSTYRQILLIGAQVVVCIILCLRIYAFYRRDKRILALVVGSGLVLFGLAVFAVIGQKSDVGVYNGCHIASSRVTAIRLAVAWEALFVYDLLIFSLTLYKTWKDRNLYAAATGSNGLNLVQLFFRDGAIYFAVMASANLANTLTFYFLQPYIRGVLSTFASSISVTMMSRVMINLHENVTPHPSRTTTDLSSSEQSTTLLFTTEYGALGSYLPSAGQHTPDTRHAPEPQDEMEFEEEGPIEEYELHDISVSRRDLARTGAAV